MLATMMKTIFSELLSTVIWMLSKLSGCSTNFRDAQTLKVDAEGDAERRACRLKGCEGDALAPPTF